MSPLSVFSALSTRRTSLSITGRWRVQPGRWPNREECQRGVKLTSCQSEGQNVSPVTEVCLFVSRDVVGDFAAFLPDGFVAINQLTAWCSQVTVKGTPLLFLSYAIRRHSICWTWKRRLFFFFTQRPPFLLLLNKSYCINWYKNFRIREDMMMNNISNLHLKLWHK